jgi:hypothetical protein
MVSLLKPDFFLTVSETVDLIVIIDYSKKLAFVWKYICYLKKDKNQAYFYCSYYKLDLVILLYKTNFAKNIMKYIKK